MKVQVINCGCMRPYGGRLWDGVTPGLGPARLACRCLVAEADDGLILVDTGFGLKDIESPRQRLPAMSAQNRPTLDPADTAVARLRQLGHAPSDVRHIVMTHLDFDHAGGIADFPNAVVHVHAFEAAAAAKREGVIGKQRYQPAQLPPDLMASMATYDPRDSRTEWMGLQALSLGRGAPPDILLVPLPGHTRGHCGVALDSGRGWVLHAGDAIFAHSELRADGAAPPLARTYEAMMQTEGSARHASANALRDLAAERGEEVAILCSHDPVTPPGDGRYEVGPWSDPPPSA